MKKRMSDLTHNDQRGRDEIPNPKKGKNNEEKSMDTLNTMKNQVAHGEIAVIEIRELLEVFQQK